MRFGSRRLRRRTSAALAAALLLSVEAAAQPATRPRAEAAEPDVGPAGPRRIEESLGLTPGGALGERFRTATSIIMAHRTPEPT